MKMAVGDVKSGVHSTPKPASHKPAGPPNGGSGLKGFLDAFHMLDGDSYRKGPDGLKIAQVTEGSGTSAAKGMSLTVRYTGWTVDGKKFDSTSNRNEPFQFTLGTGQVIKGWEEGLAGAKPGERRQLVIPAALAYGNRGQGEIPPGATLVFNIEVMAVNPPSPNTKGSMNVVA
jgi:peptidylprolyl isomerase